MKDPEIKEGETSQEVISTQSGQINESKTNNKDVYFLILRPSEEKIDFTGLNYQTKNMFEPMIAFKKKIENKEDKTFLEEIVFKFKKKARQGNNKKEFTRYKITFFEGDHIYDITFSLMDESFVYQPELKTGNKFLPNILKEPIKQNIIPLYNKLNIFIEALEKNNEANKEIKLYKDTISLYKEKKQFSLLITLFLKIYQKNKELCEKLIKIFYEINGEENNDRLNDIRNYLDLFKDIYSKAKDIIEGNKYNKVQFYAILFCYLHYYDRNNFPNMIEDFSVGNFEILCEILIQYHSHFMNPLKQKKEFYDNFVKYALKNEKKIKVFKRILDYVEDIETFLFIINSNIEHIFKIYEKLKTDPIKMTSSLKLVKYKIDKSKIVKTTDNKEDTNINDSEEDDIEILDEDDTKNLEEVNNIENECNKIIKLIDKIIEFSEREKILAIYIKSTFWINLIKEYNIPDWENISNIHKLRKLYKKYNNLVNSLSENNLNGPENIKDIKNDINMYYKRDEFAFMLNKNIKDFFAIKKNITNAEILGTVAKYNPYFSIEDEDDKKKFKNNKETYIFDYINFSKTTEAFNGTFRKLNFETMFEEIITDYINKITGKIKDIQTFGNVIKLITVERIKEDKQKDYFRILKEKYKREVKTEIKNIKGKELENAIKIIAEFVSKLFLFEKSTSFLEEEIIKLEENIKSLIYIELITNYKDNIYEKQKNCIYDIYLEKIDTKEGRDNVIKLVKNLKDDDKKSFIYEKLLEKCKFDIDEFFSNQENYKIETLCLLNKELINESIEKDKNKIKSEQKDEKKIENDEIKLNILSSAEKGNKNAQYLMAKLDVIKEKLEDGIITKRALEKFLNIKKVEKEPKSEDKKDDNKIVIEDESEYAKNKLELITLILSNYDPNSKYIEYKKNIENINYKVEKLKFIKNSLMIFHRNLYNEDIRKITDILEEIENSPIQKFNMDETRKAIESLETHNTLCEEIKKVKDFLLFKKIFENAQGGNQSELFDDATKKLGELKESFKNNSSNIELIFNEANYVNTFKDIKEELSRKSESKSKTFIDQMIDYFNIKDKVAINDLKMIINSKKYEMIVKSIKYFFDNFSDKKLNLPNSISLSEMDLKTLKKTLNELKKRNIYDYEIINSYCRVFTSFYEKKEAIDFLKSKLSINTKELSNKLKDKLDPTNRSISIKDINDTIECLTHFKIFINYNPSEIICYVKLLEEEQIKTFESFSKKFSSIIELDTKNDKDPFKEVYDIIKDASLIFYLDYEDFGYNIDGHFQKIKNIGELIKLKNKINIQPKNNIKNEEKKNGTNEIKIEKVKEKDDLFEVKCDKLLFFKNIISNLEIIYDKINILRIKGFNIPIVINVSIKYPKVSYKLNDKEKIFDKIKDYLFKVKNDYQDQLDTIYEDKKYLRLIHGKFFRKIIQHQGGSYDIPEMIRYILNKSNNKDKISDGELSSPTLGDDYEEQYHDKTEKVFNSISDYLISLFKNNELDFNKHYDNMKIKEEYNYKYKGISIKKRESPEEYILKLFIDKIGKLPIAQNILICSKETSIEEIQSFLYRAILCEYNTLFAIEILESFSNFQHNKMYSYIDKLLSIKLEKYKKDIDKSKSREYLDSYIVFVYRELKNELAFKNELEKYTKKKEDEQEINFNKMQSTIIKDDGEEKMGDLNISNISLFQDNEIINNIKVISSDVCGLGKSFLIRRMIEKEENKKYYPFPLGGKLTKNAIFDKVSNLFNKIKEDSKYIIAKGNETSKDKSDENNKVEDYSEFNNVIIHLDLIETKETSLINEFLFSFLITKFYTNNEDIIYIPNNLKIYIEIPNSFEDYLTKFGILNSFNRINITTLNGSKQNEINNVKNISMLPLELELEPKIREKFKELNGFENDKEIDKEIEKFIKENIGIKEYSYHQIQTFIKLYISQFQSFKTKIKFKNSGEDITQKCIEYFAESTKYFTNGGFAKLIMEKKYIKDKFDLCLDAYENDLKEFNTPLLFIDKESNKVIFERIPDICKDEKNNKLINKIISKDVDIVYVIDATGSMYKEIKAAEDYVIQIFKDLKEKYKEYNFQFGAVFYRDKVYTKSRYFRAPDEDEYYTLTDKIEELKSNISKVKATGGGGDGAEDWAGGYELALNKMNWREGIKLIIHICDDGAHGEQFTGGDPFYEEGEKLIKEIKECVEKNINIIGLKIKNAPEKSFEKIKEIYENHYNEFKMTNQDYGQFIEVYNFEGRNSESVSQNFYKLVMQAAKDVINPSYKYLKRLKKILNLPNDIEKQIDGKKSLLSILESGSTDNYVITDDNYKKMILLIYRIKANVPVIIMGETGCGKTSLIKILSQIINNGEELVKIININPAITDEDIINKMEELNDIAKKQDYINEKKTIKKELWIFFDEINTCLSLSLLTEIFINKTFNGIKLEDNIRLIGACNPYRKKKELIERCGLAKEDDEDDKIDKDNEDEQLVYKVKQLPQSLLYYVFSFGSLREEDEKKYIRSIIQKLFSPEEEKLHDLTTEAISKCHIFLRKSFGDDPSIVSLREIARFKACVEFFMVYFCKKNDHIKEKSEIPDKETKKLYKIKSIICSIYLCYYIRLINDKERSKFDGELLKILLKIANVYCENKEEEGKGDIKAQIKYEKFKTELRQEKFEKFSDLLRIEEEFLLEQVELDKGIGENQLIKENLFLLFLAVVTKIPLIIVGKPGTGKSLSTQLISNSMRGKYSKPKVDKKTKKKKKSFFLKYPQINQIYFQGSKSTTPEDVEELFKKADDLYKNYKAINKNSDPNSVPIYMILFDELGLAEESPTNPLKVLHSKLEYGGTEGTCFIGISNYSLDAAKVNRALNLSVPNLEDKLDQLKSTSKSIVESVSDDINNSNLIFDILARAYNLYKHYLNFIKELVTLKKYIKECEKLNKHLKGKSYGEIKKDPDFIKLLNKDKIIKSEFHGNRDFYNLIKIVAIEGSRLSSISDEKQIVPIINNAIERNFGGISYDIDIDFKTEFDDIKKDMKLIEEEILNEKLNLNKEKTNIRKKVHKVHGNDEKGQKNEDTNIKVTSVFLFKKIYNLACTLEKPKENENINPMIYQIGNDLLENYNQNKCINDNISDNNSRYLLLEIKSNIEPLINQVIRSQSSYRKDIDTVIGSPFSDDNNNDYKAKKVNEIQNFASQEDKLIILQNLDPIQPYLYDLYNMNYKIIDDQKFVKICLENFSEQLTPINDSFKIIVLVDKKFVDKIDMAFLNRLEKMQINFEDLLDEDQKKLIKNIMEEIRLKEEIKERKRFNYNINSLLINCTKEDIGGLVYYLFLEIKKENINEKMIKDKIYTKISNLLPQDIVVNLPEGNVIKSKYFSKKKYYNFKQYMKALIAGDKDLVNYKISIIYTFSNIVNIIEGYHNDNEFMVSAIDKEEKLKTYIDDIKAKNKNEKKQLPILIRFEDYNSNKMQFIADYINTYCKEDEYHYIFIIYLHRDFSLLKKQRIHSIPNIYNNINQIFIDNLDGPDISLKDLMDENKNKNIKDIMISAEVFRNLDKEFRETLTAFVYDKMAEKNKPFLEQNSKTSEFSMFLNQIYGEKNNSKADNYSEEIINYMLYIDKEFKDEIIEKAKKLIESDKDAQTDCNRLIDKMFKENYINKNKIDIISCILDYIKENVFSKYLKLIFNVLEDNNFLTTLIEINNDKTCRLCKNSTGVKPNNRNIIKELETKFLKEIKVDKNKKYEPKFLAHYKVPGFYGFYKNLSDYLNKEIIPEFLDNEKDLRNIDPNYDKSKLNITKELEYFHEKEEELLKKVIEEIEKDKIYCDFVNKITPDLILKDYITFYLQKYLGVYSKPFYDLITLLLDLRFSDEINIIKDNIENPFKIIIIKIIWIESNVNYIEGILNAFELGKEIINDNEGDIFYNMIFNSIHNKNNPIKYIVNRDRPDYLIEINECFFKILAGICLSVTTNDMDKMKIYIGSYCGILKNIYKIIKNINDDLYIYLNELFIIDELIKIIDYNPNIQKNIIKEIRYYLTENAIIIQKNQPNKNTKLIENFQNMNEKMKLIKIEEAKDKYFATLKYIYKEEIQKVKDKVYCAAILKEITNEKEIIKISNDIIQILLKSYSDLDKFKNIKDDLLKSDDNIIKLLNSKLSDDSQDYYLALSETLIYFFERNSIMYLQDFLDVEIFSKEKKEHIKIFKECNEFLYKLHIDVINEGLTYITKLFCLGYIKSFCYMFIKMHDKKNFNPENIIKIIKESDKINMVKLYIYKIIYNKNNKQMSIFLNSEIIKKYKLDSYPNFNKFINSEEIEKLAQFSYDNNSSNENYKNLYKNLEKYRKNKFEEKITKDDISPNKEIEFDDFYKAANSLILSKLNNEKFENDASYINFYFNVCEPLYNGEEDDGGNKLFTLMKFFFKKETYQQIKEEYSINSENIDALLYGYRYCLNEVNNEEGDFIYSYLYNKNNLSDFDKKFYPGNDNNNKEEPYYELYNKIVNHFKERPNEGCYVCLCDQGYYHSVPSGFPGFSEIDMKCEKCKNEIGAKEFFKHETVKQDDETKVINIKVYEIIESNDNYYRIFKDEEEINNLKNMADHYRNFQKMKYMTIQQFKEQYITPLYIKEKGLNKININDFKKENKIVRNLSQISYRILNYILYCHLFFARLYTQSIRFDNYKPKNITWFSVIKDCFNKLKIELGNKGIYNLEIFMNCIFEDLFNKLSNRKCINNFEDLLSFEDELEKLIQKKCEVAKKEIEHFKELEIESIKDEKSAIALIKEIYDKSKYNKKDFPFYEHFYYTDYLDEEYIENLLKGRDENNYPVLVKYLQFIKQKKSKVQNYYSLDNLILFNQTLQLFNGKYSNQISRDFAEKTLVKDSEIYQDKKNIKLIDDFIALYNSFGKVDEKKNQLKLNIEKNYICDFLLINDNKYGKSYREIYKKFIENQNKELELLLDKKIDSGIFNINCKSKVNIQQMKESEVFTLPKKFKVLFNSSYRKYIDTKKHENYNEYEIRLEQIEEDMTNSLLKNKKLISDKIIEFSFNNEVFSYEITDLISNFPFPNEKDDINIDDKEIIYNFIRDNAGNDEKYKEIITNFITLIEYLNRASKDENKKINGNTKICDIDIVKNTKNISKDFMEIFKEKTEEDKNNIKVNLNVSKIINIFNYFLKLIFNYVKKDIKKYQEKKDKKAYELNDEDMAIKKNALASAIRLFMTLVLYRENERDKDTKIKENKKNIIDYLKNKDLWESALYNNSKRFEEDLIKIKGLNIKIKEILFFYNYLIDNKDEGFEEEIVKRINKREEEKRKQEEIKKKLAEEEAKKDEDDQKSKYEQIRKRSEDDYDSDRGRDSDDDDDNGRRRDSDDDDDNGRRRDSDDDDDNRRRRDSDDDDDNRRRRDSDDDDDNGRRRKQGNKRRK